MAETVVPLNDADFDLQLPKPVGYRLLIALPQPEENYEGTSVLKTEKEKQLDQLKPTSLVTSTCVFNLNCEPS